MSFFPTYGNRLDIFTASTIRVVVVVAVVALALFLLALILRDIAATWRGARLGRWRRRMLARIASEVGGEVRPDGVCFSRAGRQLHLALHDDGAIDLQVAGRGLVEGLTIQGPPMLGVDQHDWPTDCDPPRIPEAWVVLVRGRALTACFHALPVDLSDAIDRAVEAARAAERVSVETHDLLCHNLTPRSP